MPRLLLVLIILPSVSVAQEARFELGQRLRLLERELNKPGMMAKRKQAIEPLTAATPAFFRGQLGEAAGLLDRARLQLIDPKPSPDRLWAESLVVRPAGRFLDVSTKELLLRVESFYRVSADRPEKVTIRWSLLGPDGKAAMTSATDLGKLPFTGKLSLKGVKKGDYQLRSEVLVGGTVLATGEQTVSLVADLSDRLTSLRKGIEATGEAKRNTEKLTLPRLRTILVDLAANKTLETNYPATALLEEAEALLVAVKAGKSRYGKDRPGQFWLEVAGEGGSDPVRVQVPNKFGKGSVPVVVAMHGVGGSENLFFDGYGDGAIAKLCAKRGWFLVTTRAPLFAFGGPDVVRVVDALAKTYPIDTKKVFLVGHSMGASQAVSAAGRKPDRFVGVAALGGGGGFRSSDALKKVRFYVGVGDKDFALGTAKALHAALVRAGVEKAVFETFDDVEHLLVVQLALPKVFAFFDEAIAPKKD
jgi:pimeloyl-ACP methyl ester carboxylesterase